VLARLALVHRAPELLLTLARLTGGLGALAPGSAVIGLRPGCVGAELKVEVPMAGLPVDPLAAVAALLAERPDSHAQFRRWLAAVGLPGMRSRASVVSARVSAETGVRLSAYVHPVADDIPEGAPAGGGATNARVG
jgi:hypothetical protein